MSGPATPDVPQSQGGEQREIQQSITTGGETPVIPPRGLRALWESTLRKLKSAEQQVSSGQHEAAFHILASATDSLHPNPPESRARDNSPEVTKKTQRQLLNDVQRGYLSQLQGKGYTVEQDYRYNVTRIMDSGGKQIGTISQTPDGRKFINVTSGQTEVVETLQDLIPKDVLYENIERGRDNQFIFYPNLTEDDLGLLRTRIEPNEGHIVVAQGEYAVVQPNDPNHVVATFGIGPCRGILIFDQKTGLCALGHADTEGFDDGILQAMRRDLLKAGAKAEDLGFYGTPNIDPIRQQSLAKIYSQAHFDRDSSFSFDTQTKQVGDSFDPMAFSQSENLNLRIGKRDEVRMKHHIPYVRAY